MSPRYWLHHRKTCALLLALVALALAFYLPSPVAAQEGSAAEPAAAPEPPALASPTDGAEVTATNYPPLAMPTLRWLPADGATIYHIQISDSPGFATVIKETDTYGIDYTPTDAYQDGSYYWRVKAGAKNKTTEWSAYSEAFSFNKNWSNDEDNRPTPISPVGGVTRSAFPAEDFSWTPSTGAAGYKLEIATDQQFGNVVYSAETVKPHHTPSERFAANTYYWRVTPFAYFTNSANRVNGTASEIATFQFAWNAPPQLIEPPALVGGQKPELRFLPRFSWTAVEGAEEYQIQISTDENFGTSVANYTTRSTDFTPVQTLSNDQEYFWRVKAINYDGFSSAWSDIRSFRAKWNVAPKLLAPANNQRLVSYPYFHWEPVAGAERYKIKITDGSGDSAQLMAEATIYNVNNYAHPGPWLKPIQFDHDYYWQVQAIDARYNYTPWSQAFSFRFSGPQVLADWALPAISNLVYPLPYYMPDSAAHPVHDDHSIAWPLFVWDTAHASEVSITSTLTVKSINYAAIPDYYQLSVATADTFAPGTIVYQTTTRGLAVAPTSSNPWQPQDGQVYFWRVRPYWSALGSAYPPTAQVWQTRYDSSSSVYAPTTTLTPMYPADGYQAVASPPVLGWLPYEGAASYHVQISRRPDASFESLVIDEAHALSINYVPWQERLTDMPPGSYWWRVRPESSPGTPIGDWSIVQRFDLANDLVTGNFYDLPVDLYEGSTIIADTAIYSFSLQATSASVTGNEYDIGELHAMLARDNNRADNLFWVLSFTAAPTVPSAVTYDLYIDSDHISNSGATYNHDRDDVPSSGSWLTFDEYHRPEYVIRIQRSSSGVGADSVYLRRWQNGNWLAKETFAGIGGEAWFSDSGSAVELLVPYSALGGADDSFSGSLALALFSTTESPSLGIRDSIPTQGAIYGVSNQLDQFTFISDMLLPLYPFDTPLTNPDQFYEMPVLRWRMPYYDSVDGYQVQVARDARFSDIVETWETEEINTATAFGILPTAFVSKNAYDDNETYYWRARIRHERYRPPGQPIAWDYGPWSPAMRFKLSSRLPGNPQLSTGAEVFMTPTFLWDRVEGASGYTLQIDNDANFSSPIVNQALDGTSYTPQELSLNLALLPGTQYYWRLAMRRSATVYGQWTPTMTFQKSSVSPTPINPSQGMTVTGQPTFQWSVVLTPTTTPRLATPRYHLQVDDDPTFGSPLIDIETPATTYTPVKGKSLSDGIWYWRVALYDANGNDGPFSPTQWFAKQYLAPNLIFPGQGGTAGTVPTFMWDPLPGAAYYSVSYADNPAFTSATTVSTMSTCYTTVKSMNTGRYYWYVQMFDQDKKGGPIIPRYYDFGYSLFLPSAMK